MNYVILDLEWDGSYYPKINGFMNQILQIGAVKLNAGFDIIDTFDVIIKSSFSKRLSKRFTELTGITKEKMLSGMSLNDAFKAYNYWVGDDAVTMTWSNSDIYTVLENEKKLLSGTKLKLEKYLDLQKYIQGEMKLLGIECNSQISLLNAAIALGVDVDEAALHDAKADSLVCATLLKRFYNRERFNALVTDASAPDFFERYTFKPYYITDISNGDIEKTQLDFFCPDCKKQLKIKKNWKSRFGGFNAVLQCVDCGKEYNANVKFKKMFDTVKVRRRLSEKKPVQKDINNE
ncbi:MAG: exonuclease domain-containing protein [Clostridia bacterium]|nr:exonuclease domain-containing protein [Clostridia bacterium]